MCLNGWGGKLHAELVDYVADVRPDVLCLQEATRTPASAREWLTYRDDAHVLPQRANFLMDVAAALPEHSVTFCPTGQGELWHGEVSFPSQWGLATFIHCSLAVVAQAQGFVHKSYSPDGFGDHPRSRAGHAVRIYDHRRNRPVSIAQMHGLRDLRGKMDTPERAHQVRRFMSLSDQVSEEGDLRVLCGDFNVEPGSETLAFLERKGFTDLVSTMDFDGTRTSHYAKPGRYADYMLIDRPDEVRRFQVVYEPEISDHCPLVLEI